MVGVGGEGFAHALKNDVTPMNPGIQFPLESPDGSRASGKVEFALASTADKEAEGSSSSSSSLQSGFEVPTPGMYEVSEVSRKVPR